MRRGTSPAATQAGAIASTRFDPPSSPSALQANLLFPCAGSAARPARIAGVLGRAGIGGSSFPLRVMTESLPVIVSQRFSQPLPSRTDWLAAEAGVCGGAGAELQPGMDRVAMISQPVRGRPPFGLAVALGIAAERVGSIARSVS